MKGGDHGGYPTCAAIDKIKTWGIEDYNGLIKFVCDIWRWNDYIWDDDNFYYFITGGWSGNELIIDAMISNYLVFSIYHYATIRGGKFIFLKPESRKYLFDIKIIKIDEIG